jgi:hypothetical protein
MATDTYTVSAKLTTATQIVWAGEGPVLIANTDLTQTIYLTENNAARVGDNQGLVALGPNGSVGVDGTRDFFAVTASTTPVQVATVSGGMTTFLGLTAGNGSLVLPSLFSPGFVSGVSGWSINKNGSAEFNSITIRGSTIIGTLSLQYNGTPALGNLIASSASVGGIDSFGNIYYAGVYNYSPSGGAAPLFAVGLSQGDLLIGSSNALTGIGGASPGNVMWAGDGWTNVNSGLSSGTDTEAAILLKSKTNTGTGGPIVEAVGSLIALDGLDGNTYQTENATLVSASILTSTQTVQTIPNLSCPVAARSYFIDAEVNLSANQAAGQMIMRWNGPAGTTGTLNFVTFEGVATWDVGSQPFNTNVNLSYTMGAIGAVYLTRIRGIATFANAGTLSLAFVQTVAGDSATSQIGSFMRISPID